MQPPERLVLCGSAAASGPERADALVLDVDAPEGTAERVKLSLWRITGAMAANLPERFGDLLEIACYVYCADQFTRRESPLMRDMGARWRRRFRFRIPVRDLATWRRPELLEALADTLGFLSEDEYRFEFVQAEAKRGFQPYLDLQGDGPPAGFDPDRILLFSGGLDSFTGAAESVLRGERIALVSHQSSPMLRGKQSSLVHALRERSPPAQLFHVSVVANKGSEEAREFTQRARSFLFATLGFVVARMFRKPEASFFENGVVSLNLPLAEHILGARSTRTTHPRTLFEFGRFFSLVAGESFQFVNPYFWQIKADVVRKLADLGCADLIASTFSCTRVRDATKHKKHCGLCSQCLDRRFAVLAAGQGSRESDDFYGVDLFAGDREPGLDLTLAESYVLTAAKLSKITEQAFFANYGQIFRALRYLGGDRLQTAANLHQLHVRHGLAVASVVDRELVRRASLQQVLALPERSLLAMIHKPMAAQPVLSDPVETEPRASAQAAASSYREVPRPIRFAIDRERSRIVFDYGVSLQGPSFKLLAELFEIYRADQNDNKPPDKCRPIRANLLAKRLKVREQTLRQYVRRARQQLHECFQEAVGAALNDEDIIENVMGRGYRLNPYLQFSTVAVIEASNAADRGAVTGSSSDVTSQRSERQKSPRPPP